MNVTIFGNRVYANVMKLRRSHTGLEWAPNPMTGVLVRERRRYTEAHKGEGAHVTTEAETGVTQLQI